MSANVAVIIPVFNREKIIVETLESVAAQTVLPRALIVVDDGSTDGTADVVKAWMETQKGRMTVEYVHQENRGVSAARNHGLRKAPPTEFVAFLDSDDVWPVDFVERTNALLEKDAAAVAAICEQSCGIDWRVLPVLRRVIGLVLIYTGFRILLRPWLVRRPHRSHKYLPRDPVAWILRNGSALSSCSLFRRSLIDQLGGFDESLQTGEDAALYLPLSMRGSWRYAPGAPVRRKTQVLRYYENEKNLSRRFVNNHERWVLLYEEILQRPEFSGLNKEWVAYRLARMWYLAGNEFLYKKEKTEARRMYARALDYNPMHMRARLKKIFYTHVHADS